MFNKILVPLDGSTLAERSIPHAELFARIFGANIVLLKVLEPAAYHDNPSPVDPLSWQIHKAEADIYLRVTAARIEGALRRGARPEDKDKKKFKVEYAIREGKVAESIIDFAHTENVDLVVISTHGSSGLSRWTISSITQKVINLIYLPVLIVRAYQPAETNESKIHYHHILVPVDSSRRAECSLPVGIALVQGVTLPSVEVGDLAKLPVTVPQSAPEASDGLPDSPKLILASVIKPPELPIPEPYPAEVGQLSESLMQASRQAVYNYLNEMKERLPVECEMRVAEDASVSSAIQEMAGQKDIDLVILCAHGHTGQFTWPYGAITRDYIDHGTKPVLIIQDIHSSKIRPTAAELAAKESGKR
jgi:nucleotide-binding universal stress UspA family protein